MHTNASTPSFLLVKLQVIAFINFAYLYFSNLYSYQVQNKHFEDIWQITTPRTVNHAI